MPKWSAIRDDLLTLIRTDVNGLNFSVAPSLPNQGRSLAPRKPSVPGLTLVWQPDAHLAIVQIRRCGS